jgi:hypothetical protein
MPGQMSAGSDITSTQLSDWHSGGMTHFRHSAMEEAPFKRAEQKGRECKEALEFSL